MKKLKTKLFAIVLCVAMIVTLLPTLVFADVEDPAGAAVTGNVIQMTEGEILPGFVPAGTNCESSDPAIAWVDGNGNLDAFKVGQAVITSFNASGEATGRYSVVVSDYQDGSEIVGQLKILARFNDNMDFYDGHSYLLFTSYKDGVEVNCDDLYGGYHISDQYYADIRADIANGSNHTNPGQTEEERIAEAEKYFTFDNTMTGVTLNRGEIVTIGMYRDFDLSVQEAAIGSIKNSSLWKTLSTAAKLAILGKLAGAAGGEGANSADIAAIIPALKAQGVELSLLDGVVDGGVCFNRELYNQKLEWDQFENVTYEMDITQNQLNAMIATLSGNKNRFSMFNNSCATIAINAWNAAVGTRNGVDTAFKLEASGSGPFPTMESPMSVRDSIVRHLPAHYLNNQAGVAEPYAGYQDETGFVYVSAPANPDLEIETTDPGEVVPVEPIVSNDAVITYNESDEYFLVCKDPDGAVTTITESGTRVKKGSALAVKAAPLSSKALAGVTFNGKSVALGKKMYVKGDSQIEVTLKNAKIAGIPEEVKLNKKGDTYQLKGVVQYTDDPKATVYDPSIRYESLDPLVTVSKTGKIMVTGDIPIGGKAVIVSAYAGSSGDKVVAKCKVNVGNYQGSRKVGTITILGRSTTDQELMQHCGVTFTTYEDVDIDISYYEYYKPNSKFKALMEDYRDHPEKYSSDPAIYNGNALGLSDRESYFDIINHGNFSQPSTVSLAAGESLTISDYNFGGDAQSLLLDELLRRPSNGGITVNREIFQEFRSYASQLPNYYYTVEITADELARMRDYLANPNNNYYGLLRKNCGTVAVELWNTALADNPELQLYGKQAGLFVDPQLIYGELQVLQTKKDLRGYGGADFYPRTVAYKGATTSGQFKEKNGVLGYYVGGSLATSVTDIIKDSVTGTWYYVQNGIVDRNFVGIEKNVNGWWYIKNGQVDFTHTGVEKNRYGWWAIINGQVQFDFWGFLPNEYGWWYLENGKVTFERNDIIKGKANNAPNKAGEAGWWLVRGSKVVDQTTIAKNSNGWWYCKNGKVDFDYTGLASNEYGTWYCKNGKVDFGYNGKIEGKRIVNGKVQ